MKNAINWSYAPYSPYFFETGDIYICRVAPDESTITFDWLCIGADSYDIYIKKVDEDCFVKAGSSKECTFTIENLSINTDYEFYVCTENKKSRVRLARCGQKEGNVVNYLHPDDEAYSFSGRYLCSPSLVRHPDGFLLASMDLYEIATPQNLALIYRSDDEGKTWKYVSELMPCFWGKMFIHNGELYMLSCSTEYGDLLIGKSTDGGKTFSAPVALLRGSNGKGKNAGVHKNPQNILIHNGRIYATLEWGDWNNHKYGFGAMVMSCDINDDLLCAKNWSFTEPRKFSQFDDELKGFPDDTMTIEGTLALSPEGKLLNIMRFGKYGKAIAYEVNTSNHEAPLEYYGLIDFPANYAKFMIKYDNISKKYYSIANRLYGKNNHDRNYLMLMYSDNLKEWHDAYAVYDYRDHDSEKVGFQYVDFEIEGNDIIFLCRTAMNNANSFHDSNYSTFDKIKNFRQYIKE